MAETRTYRHKVTGEPGVYPVALALVFPDVMEEVDPDAKPLAYTPISPEAITELRDADTTGPSDDHPTADASDSSPVAPSPAPAIKKAK